MPDDELVEVIDVDNIPQTTKTLDECIKHGLLHRSVAVFLRNSAGEIFLQQRSLRDSWFPGRWTISSAGHVRAGESPNDAAKRELGEELGLILDPRFLFQYLLPKFSYLGKIEHEMAFAFEAQSKEQQVKIDPEEVEQGRYLAVEDCKNFLENSSHEITPDALLLFQKYFELQDT